MTQSGRHAQAVTTLAVVSLTGRKHLRGGVRLRLERPCTCCKTVDTVCASGVHTGVQRPPSSSRAKDSCKHPRARRPTGPWPAAQSRLQHLPKKRLTAVLSQAERFPETLVTLSFVLCIRAFAYFWGCAVGFDPGLVVLSSFTELPPWETPARRRPTSRYLYSTPFSRVEHASCRLHSTLANPFYIWPRP